MILDLPSFHYELCLTSTHVIWGYFVFNYLFGLFAARSYYAKNGDADEAVICFIFSPIVMPLTVLRSIVTFGLNKK